MSLIRSFTLWSGVLVTVALLWFWADGHGSYISHASYTYGTLGVGIASHSEGIGAGYHRSTGGRPPLMSPGFHYGRSKGSSGPVLVPPWFPPAIAIHKEEDNGFSGVQASFEIAHWFLLLMAVSVWGFLFHFRHRHMGRSTDSPQDSPGEE